MRSRSCYEKTGWTTADVDLFEINEAFAVVTMAAMQRPRDRRTTRSTSTAAPARWAIRSARPGARIIVTLLGALRKYGGKRGVAALCIGGGEATALAIERV